MLSMLTSLVMAISLAGLMPTVWAGASSLKTSGDYEYIVLDNGTAEIVRYLGKEETVVIPETLDGLTVTSIDYWTGEPVEDGGNGMGSLVGAFETNPYIKWVVIPETVTHIGENTFFLCENLETVVIPRSVTSIGDDAFLFCDKLTLKCLHYTYGKQYAIDNEIPYQIIYKNLTEGNFKYNITADGTIDIVEYIGEEEHVVIPDTIAGKPVTSITGGAGDSPIYPWQYGMGLWVGAFFRCETVKKITIPKTVTYIDEDACGEPWDRIEPVIRCYENSAAHEFALYNGFGFEFIQETQLTANIYYQLKPDNSTIRFVTEVDIKDVQAAESGEYRVSLGGEQVDTQQVIGAYKAIYANGELVEAPEGKCYVISKTYAGFSTDDSLTFEMNLSNYDKGISRDVII